VRQSQIRVVRSVLRKMFVILGTREAPTACDVGRADVTDTLGYSRHGLEAAIGPLYPFLMLRGAVFFTIEPQELSRFQPRIFVSMTKAAAKYMFRSRRVMMAHFHLIDHLCFRV